VGCAAALATINVIAEENILAHVTEMGEYAKSRMKQMQEKFPLIADVRGIGLLMGIELVKNRETKEKALDEAEQMMYRSLKKGLSFKLTMGNILTLTPPLTISREEMDQALSILEECFEEISS
jgi:4-aminobutyrate aminotransferase